MLVKCLLENTTQWKNIESEHGLSIYIETKNHKILFDMGQTGIFADNAEKMGVNLKDVDIAIISHGHYDHGGGLKRFFEINSKAPVYISKYAFEPHYHGAQKYIGLDRELLKQDRFVFTEGDVKLDKNLTLYTSLKRPKLYETDAFGLSYEMNGELIDEDFKHEQYLEIVEDGKRVLFSGCSHNGILNIENWFNPDVLIGGFHFSKLDTEKDSEKLQFASDELLKHKTLYYTCHCTGLKQYEFLKERMKDNLRYLSAGETLKITLY